MFGNIFAQGHGFDAVTVKSSKYFVSLHYLDRDKLKSKFYMVSKISFY